MFGYSINRSINIGETKYVEELGHIYGLRSTEKPGIEQLLIAQESGFTILISGGEIEGSRSISWNRLRAIE